MELLATKAVWGAVVSMVFGLFVALAAAKSEPGSKHAGGLGFVVFVASTTYMAAIGWLPGWVWGATVVLLSVPAGMFVAHNVVGRSV